MFDPNDVPSVTAETTADLHIPAEYRATLTPADARSAPMLAPCKAGIMRLEAGVRVRGSWLVGWPIVVDRCWLSLRRCGQTWPVGLDEPVPVEPPARLWIVVWLAEPRLAQA